MNPRTAALLIASIAATGCGPRATPSDGEPSINVAQGRPVVVLGGRGEGRVLTDGRLATEGTFPRGHSVALDGVRSAVIVDLGGARRVGALLLQASTSDVYFVESSTDAVSWRLAWRVPGVPGRPVLRTWTTVLPRAVPARWLRVRTTTSRSAAVSELQAYETSTPVWPLLNTAPPGSPLPLWPALSPSRLAAVYEALAALLMLVVAWGLLARRSTPRPREERVRRGAFFALAFVSLMAWPYLFNFHFPRFVHASEMFHYYMGAKYLPELGYTRLYACTLVVDAEDGVDLTDRVVRDLRDNRRVPAASQLERSAECHARFTARRWEAFRHDTAFFRNAMGEHGWFRARDDHGFNATPAWAVLGGLLAGLTPASWAQIVPLALLDLALLAGLFVMIGRGFGAEAAALAAGYFGLNFLSQFGWTGGSLLRYDWLFLLVAGVVALRTERPALAGFALASSTLLRVFPVCAFLGLGLKALAEVVQGRSLRPLLRYRRFAAGSLAAGVLLLSTSVLQNGRARIWTEFAENTTKHMATESVNYVGLPIFLGYDPASRIEIMTDPLLPDLVAAWRERVADSERRVRGAHWAATAAFLLLLTMAVRRASDWTAATLGVGLMPILLKLSGYYYSGWLVYAVLWPVSAGSGLALAAFVWATNVIPQVWPGADEMYAWLSLAAVILAAGITGAFAWRGRADRRSAEARNGEPGTS
ncbi:MAG: hypothetical protein PVJ73_03165 [Acidobacteriota bacterium]